MNAGFADMGYKFNLIETTRTVNDTWYLFISKKGEIVVDSHCRFYNATQYGPIEKDMKTALHKGDRKTLNTYVMGYVFLHILLR